MLVLGIAEWSELSLVKLVVMLLVVLKHCCLCFILSLVGSHFCFRLVGVL